MKRRIIAFMLALAMAAALPGCSFLERGYGSVEPHSSSYYESEAGDVLRAENYQDLVNDLLVLIGDHAAGGTIWLYPGKETLDAEQALEQACQEVQRETPMGSYAVEYMTYTVAEDNRSYSEITLSIGYRCTEAQLQAIVHATSVSALHALLTAAAVLLLPQLLALLGITPGQKARRRASAARHSARAAILDSCHRHYRDAGRGGAV